MNRYITEVNYSVNNTANQNQLKSYKTTNVQYFTQINNDHLLRERIPELFLRFKIGRVKF